VRASADGRKSMYIKMGYKSPSYKVYIPRSNTASYYTAGGYVYSDKSTIEVGTEVRRLCTQGGRLTTRG
jgi:hypothetical protein